MNNEERLLLIDREINNSNSAYNYAASKDGAKVALSLLGGDGSDVAISLAEGGLVKKAGGDAWLLYLSKKIDNAFAELGEPPLTYEEINALPERIPEAISPNQSGDSVSALIFLGQTYSGESKVYLTELFNIFSSIQNKLIEQGIGQSPVTPGSVFDFLSKIVSQTGLSDAISALDNLDEWQTHVNELGGAFNLNQAMELDKQSLLLSSRNLVDSSYYNSITQQISNWLISNNSASNTSGFGGSFWNYNFGLDFTTPIGAFYDSQSTTYDNALSIAAYTPVLEDANGNPLSAAQLAALDSNADGRVDTAESGNLRFWQDLNENGQAEAGELTGVNRNIAALDYSFYTRANGRIAPAAPAAPQAVQGINAPAQYVPDSNYRTLRDTDNIFYTSGGWIDWSSSQIKINNNSRDTLVGTLVGTDGNDSFDANYYAAYPQYFDTSLLTRFLAGAGDDIMGGSTRNDSLWGGEGHDTLLGYAGDDMLYGEQNNDELQGGDGSDTLDGGIGDDRLFGQAGADTLFGDAGLDELQGGDGNDQLLGGADNDRLFGQTGYDILWGGDGNDLLSGAGCNNWLNGNAANEGVWQRAA